MRPAPALVLALLLAPGASACSWVAPRPLESLAWLSDGTLVGSTGHFETGPVDLANGTARGAWPSAAVVSPDGRFVVFPRAGPDVQTGPTRMADSCDLYLSRHLVAYDRRDGSLALAARGPVWGMGSSDEGVLAFDGRTMDVLEWGTWRVLRDAPAAGIVEPLHWRERLSLSPDAEAYVDPREGTLRSLDGSTERPLVTDGETLHGVAFAPDGSHVAVQTTRADGTWELRIARLDDLAVVAREPGLSKPRALAWGAQGLAIVAWPERADAGAPTLTVWPGAPEPASRWHRALPGEPAGLAWSATGERLAVSIPRDDTNAHVLVYDARLDLQERADVRVESGARALHARAGREVPVPTYTLEEKLRATPLAPLVLVAALALGARLSRRG